MKRLKMALESTGARCPRTGKSSQTPSAVKRSRFSTCWSATASDAAALATYGGLNGAVARCAVPFILTTDTEWLWQILAVRCIPKAAQGGSVLWDEPRMDEVLQPGDIGDRCGERRSTLGVPW